MYCSEIIDLYLSGIKWEINDVSFVQREKWAKQVASQQITQESQVLATQTAQPVAQIVPVIAPTSSISIDMVKTMAARPYDINALSRMLCETNHPLKTGAKNTVVPHIAQNPNGLLIITDIPGTDDDESGKILSGNVGDLMDKMLWAIGMSRKEVSILPLVFWRTPGGRTPTRTELDLAKPFVDRFIEFINPKYILTLGATASTEILGVSISNSHGKQIKKDNITAIPIYHPNYLLLKPSAKRDVWMALQELQNLLKNA